MVNPALRPQDLRDTVEAAARLYLSGDYYVWEREPGKRSLTMELATQMGLGPNTIRNRLEQANRRLGLTVEGVAHEPVELTEDDLDVLPDGLAVLERHAAGNASYIEAKRRKRVRVIPVRPEPFAVAFLGDPHLDNKGTDLTALKRDMDLLRATNTRAINMGDLLDNFHKTAKLASKQAENRVSAPEAAAMARWFIRDSGVRFDAHLLGNHDHWPGDAYGTMLQQWAADVRARLYDWMVKIVYQWEGGSFTVLAAHDFKGHSVHNKLHGLFRRAMEDGTADLYVAGHRHEAAQADFENGFRERHYNFLRVKGYKAWDDYAYVKGFPQQEEGASGLAVIDPSAATKSGRCRTFLDIAEGLEHLSLVRQRYG